MLNDSIAMSSNLLVNVLSYNNQLEINRMCWGNNACYSVTANMCSRDNNKCPQLAFGPIQETCIKNIHTFGGCKNFLGAKQPTVEKLHFILC